MFLLRHSVGPRHAVRYGVEAAVSLKAEVFAFPRAKVASALRRSLPDHLSGLHQAQRREARLVFNCWRLLVPTEGTS